MDHDAAGTPTSASQVGGPSAFLQVSGLPVLVAPSRKRFLGELLADGADWADAGHGERLRPAAERDDATAALTVTAATAGAWAVRVHEVRASADAVRVVAQLSQERGHDR